MSNKEVVELINQIEGQCRTSITRQNIFDTPSRIYFAIKIMFQNYKKAHELELMQERVYEIKINRELNDRFEGKRVSASVLFDQHQFSERDILKFIKIKDYLIETDKVELYGQIFKSINKLNKINSVIKCYRQLLNIQYMNKKKDMYNLIQKKMVDKIITMRLNSQDFARIAKGILSLPEIKFKMLEMIAYLFQKVENLENFDQLYIIFQRNFPTNPTRHDIQNLVKICIPQTYSKIVTLIEKGQNNIFQIVEKEAKHKLKIMQRTMSNKNECILNFIVMVAKYGRPIWSDIIEWQNKATQEPKNFLKQRLEGILLNMLKDTNYFQTVLNIIEKITEIDEHSQIGLIFVRELLKIENSNYLNHIVVRKFLAIKILKYNNSQEYLTQIFGNNLKYVEIILQMFKFEANVLSFYQNIINNEESFRHLKNYLIELEDKKPAKFKQFFLKGALAAKGEILLHFNQKLLKCLGQIISIEAAVNLVRDLNNFYPSKCTASLLNRLLSTFKEDKNFNVLKIHIVRSLNVMLIKTPPEELNVQFKIHLPTLIKQYLIQDSQLVFAGVSEATNIELKRAYDEYLAKNKI